LFFLSYSLQYSCSILHACCFNDNMLCGGSILFKCIWGPRGFLYQNGQNSLLFVIQFCWVGGFSLPRSCAGLCSQGWIGEFHVVHGAYLFVLSVDTQAGLEPVAVAAAVRNGTRFSQCIMVWRGFPQTRGSGCW
jgi:hypothetical protein